MELKNIRLKLNNDAPYDCVYLDDNGKEFTEKEVPGVKQMKAKKQKLKKFMELVVEECCEYISGGRGLEIKIGLEIEDGR